MRRADARECWVSARLRPRAALDAGLADSTPHALAALLDGRAEAMFGVAPSPLPGHGLIWLLGTDECARHGLTLTRGARLWIPWLSQGWHQIGNYVHAENHVHVRWMEALGFHLVRETTLGPEQAPFKEYLLRCASRS